MDQDFTGRWVGETLLRYQLLHAGGGREARPDVWRGETRSWMTTSHKQQCGVQLIVLRHDSSHYTAGLGGLCDG